MARTKVTIAYNLPGVTGWHELNDAFMPIDTRLERVLFEIDKIMEGEAIFIEGGVDQHINVTKLLRDALREYRALKDLMKEN